MEWTPPNPLVQPGDTLPEPTYDEKTGWQKDEITTRLRPGEFRGFGGKAEKRRRKKGRR